MIDNQDIENRLKLMEEKLDSIEKKLGGKNVFKDYAMPIANLIFGLTLSVLGIIISGRQRDTDLKIQNLSSQSETNLKKAQLYQELIPTLSTDNLKQNELATVGMYLIDDKLAIQLYDIYQSPGAIEAIRTLRNNPIYRKRVDSLLQSAANKKLLDYVNNDTTKAESSPGIDALKFAFQELKNNAREVTSAGSPGPFVDKYLKATGIAPAGNIDDWSVPFVAWCFVNQNKAPQLDFMKKTIDLTEFYNKLNSKGYLRKDNTPEPGDIVFFDFQDKVNGIQQCGIVYSSDSEFVYTIDVGDNKAVSEHKRYLADVKGFAHIPGTDN